MKLQYLKEVCFEELLNKLEENKKKYESSDAWLDEYFQGKEYFSESSVEINDTGDLLIDGADENTLDFHNCRLIYSSMNMLTEHQAANKFLWTYLCHKKYWKYMRSRWPVEKDRSIKDRYFCGNSRRSLLRNAVARLWWYGYLTYDANRTDPFELTAVLLSDSDFCVSVSERNYSAGKNVIQGVLSAVKKYKSQFDEYPSRQTRRELGVFINRKGGASFLDIYKVEEVEKFAWDFLIIKEQIKMP